MNKISKLSLMLIITGIFTSISLAQYKPSKERGDVKWRTKGQMEGNQIRTTIFNFGQTGREGGQFPINVQTPYEWPKNTGHVYLAMTGIFVGGEVVDNDGQIQHIIDVMNYRQSPQGKSWNFEPVPGYLNKTKNEIATSVDPETWPSFWPDRMQDQVDPGWSGSWNGYFGKNKFNADQEMYYHASDDNYDRYTAYFPDTTDLTRKGLGIILNVRALAWSQVLVQDALYLLHYIKNDGTKDIAKVGFTLWYADFVGGDGDSQDDRSDFDLLDDIAWTRDYDNRAPLFGSDPVGAVAAVFLETPGNATDRIDNDGDSPEMGPKVTMDMLDGEDPTNQIDDNGNGLIDENQTHVPFGQQEGVTFADRIGEPIDQAWVAKHPRFHREENSPVVTQEMINEANRDASNKWKQWPPMDSLQNGQVHLIEVTQDKLGMLFKDGIDNDGNGEEDSPVITQEMINTATSDPYHRYRVNNKIILYNVVQSTLGMKYADGIDNNNDGAVDENIDEGIDVMIDESRDNGIDDDYDWNPLTDDTGLDGVPSTGDHGEDDGKPTSGARFGLPGEKGIDVTDVSETDQIGITNADYVPAGGLNINSDAQMWFDFMIPGKFYDPQEVTFGEYDLFVSSNLFPLKAGQTEPISIAIILANGPVTDPGGEFRRKEILRKKVRAQETYNNDYQFANAPLTPTLTAIPGDNRVTLHWDDIAETSFDSYIDAIGGNGYDFEGYRIYRSSDPAFADAEIITNGYGILQFKQPIAQFDKKDGITGFDSVGIDGIHFYLGDDSGLKHSFVDTTVQNGFTYYYAITSYDFGYQAGGIIPAECPIRVSLQQDGSVKLSSNVVRVTPEAPTAGYVPASLSTFEHYAGSTTGQIRYDMVDINQVRNGHVYVISFEDTVKVAQKPGAPDTLTTKNFTLIDSTANRVLIEKNPHLSSDYEQPLTDGFRLKFFNETRVELDKVKTAWSDTNIVEYVFERFVFPGGINGVQQPSDYRIEFGDVGFGQSKEWKLANLTIPSVPVNFKVFNKSTGKYIDFMFIEVDNTGGAGILSTGAGAKRDRIVFLEPDSKGQLQFTWTFYLLGTPATQPGKRFPQAGDQINIQLKKPFLSSDRFRFVATAQTMDNELAKAQLDNIKVVPNPYVATAAWEIKNPYSSGRGPRDLHFTHLPAKCTIRIFTINGELVDIIEHDSPLNDGTEKWDMLSKDRLSISYGIYVYQVDAPGIGQKIGKFAVIK